MNKNPLEFMLDPENGEDTGAEYRRCFMSRDVVTELSSDFTLPDYYPEIRKLLRIETNVSPAGRYIGGGTVMFSGKVDYEMIYVTADGGLAGAPLGCDYAFEVPLTRPDNAFDPFVPEVIADLRVENAVGRVTSQRKVSVKCRLNSRVRGYCLFKYAPQIDGNVKCEKLTEEILCADSRRYMGEEFTISAQIPVETELLTPVCSRSEAYIKEISATGGLVTVSGEAKLKFLCTEEGRPREICENLPFTCEIETDTHGDSAAQELWTAFPYVTDTDVTLEDGNISARVTLICCADMHRNSPLTVVKDIYSTEGTETIETETLGYDGAVESGCDTVRFSQTLRLGNLQLTDDSLAFAGYGTAEINGCAYENGKISLSGNCRISTVVFASGEYSVIEENIPVSLSVPSKKPEGDLKLIGRAVVHDVECKTENGAITVEGSVYISYCALEERNATVVKSADFERSQEHESGITVCYPAAGQTMWGVAKKYRVPLKTVASANDLPMSAMSDPLPENVKYVIICK